MLEKNLSKIPVQVAINWGLKEPMKGEQNGVE